MSFPSIEAKKITVAVWDQRAMVVDGSRKENFVGYMRSASGIPYPMGTQSGRPFITEISRSIVDGFRSNGVDVYEISTTAHTSREEILSMAKRAHNDYFLLIKCDELHADGYMRHKLLYDLKLFVFDSNGEQLYYRSYKGKDDMLRGGGFRKYMPATVIALFEQTISDTDFLRTLAIK